MKIDKAKTTGKSSMKINQAVILSGGLGTRLRPITHKVPKSMVRINGRPFLEYQLAYLKKQGIKQALFLTGYLHEEIESYFGGGFEEVTLEYSVEQEPLGTAGALKNAESLLDSSFFLLNGDTYLPVEFSSLLSSFSKFNSPLAMLCAYENRDKIAKNNLLVDKKGKVTSCAESPDANCVNAGASIMLKKSLKHIPDSGSLEFDAYPGLISEGQLYAHISGQRFYDIGTFERLKIAERMLKAEK